MAERAELTAKPPSIRHRGVSANFSWIDIKGNDTLVMEELYGAISDDCTNDAGKIPNYLRFNFLKFFFYLWDVEDAQSFLVPFFPFLFNRFSLAPGLDA